MIIAVTVVTTALASAQAPLLPDSSQTTVLTAVVAEQAKITVPSGVTFTVNDISANTVAGAANVTVENIVLLTATKQLKISLQADAASFTSSAATWAAGDVSWAAASFTNGSGAAGTLSNSTPNAVATCTADASACNTTDLVFTLAANTGVKRSGNHTLTMRWKIESIGS